MPISYSGFSGRSAAASRTSILPVTAVAYPFDVGWFVFWVWFQFRHGFGVAY